MTSDSSCTDERSFNAFECCDCKARFCVCILAHFPSRVDESGQRLSIGDAKDDEQPL